MTKDEAHELIDTLFDMQDIEPETEKKEEPKRKLPEGKRVVRTKAQGDKVYYVDEVKKTRQWVTNPEVLDSLGFEMDDVVEVEDQELLKYQMSTALYKPVTDAA